MSRQFADEEARRLLECEVAVGSMSWAARITAHDFAEFLRGQTSAFAVILASVIRPYLDLRLRVRWPRVQVADREDWAAMAVATLWGWWVRRPMDRPATMPALLAYASKTLDRLVLHDLRKRDKHRSVQSGEHDVHELAGVLVPEIEAEAAPEWLCSLLDGWALAPPSSTTGPLRALLPGIAGFARSRGRLPTVRDLIAVFLLSPRTAYRRNAEMNTLLRCAIEESDDDV